MTYPTAPRVLSFSVLTGWYEAPIPYASGYTDTGVPIPADFDGWSVEGGIYSGETLLLDMASTTGRTSLGAVDIDGLPYPCLNISATVSAVEDIDPGQYEAAFRFVTDLGAKFPALAAVVIVTNP